MIVNGEVESTSAKVVTLEDKLTHKDWKSRLDAYEELLNKFDDPAQCGKYGSFLKSILSETNVVALEKGVAVAQKYVDNASASNVAKHADDLTQCIIAKCFMSAKQSIRQSSGEAVLSLIEAEHAPLVMAAILAAMDGKNPKSAAACINLTTQALSGFGPQVIGLKPVLKKLAALFENRDKLVRDEAKLLTVEIYRWIGKDALQQFLEPLKPVQVADLQTSFDALQQASGDSGPPKPTRFLKSVQMQQRLKAANTDGKNDDTAVYASVVTAGVAEMDLFDAVDIVSTLPKDFYTKVRSAKWQDRRDALETLTKSAAKARKLDPKSDYSIITSCLKMIIQKDANINVVTQALVALTSLATGLQLHLPSASAFVLLVLEKFKEKKAFVLEPARAATDALLPAISTFDAVVELVLPFLTHKTPSVKTECLQMMARYISHRPPSARCVTKKTIATLCKGGIACTNDPDPLVRDAGFCMLGHLQKAWGESNAPLTTLFADVDKLKAGRIREYADKAKISQGVVPNQPQLPEKIAAGSSSKLGPSNAATAQHPPVTRVPLQQRKPVASGADATRDIEAESVSGSSTTTTASRIPAVRGRVGAAPAQLSRINASTASRAQPQQQQAARSASKSASKGRAGRQRMPSHRSENEASDADYADKNDDDEGFLAAAAAADSLHSASSSIAMPLFVNAKDTKKKRAYEEKYVRQFDWVNDAVGGFSTRQMQYLAQKFKQCCHPTLHSALFMDDESCWLNAIEMLIKQSKTPSKTAAIAENSDLLLKWCGARLRNDGVPCSPELFLRILSLVNVIVDALVKNPQIANSRLSEDDAYSFVPAILRQTSSPPNDEVMNYEQLSTFLMSRLCLVIDYAALYSLLVHTAAAGLVASGGVGGEQPFAVRRRALQLALLLCNQFGATVCGCVSAREQETLTCMARLALGSGGSAGSDQRSIEIRTLAVQLCEKFYQVLVATTCANNEMKAVDTLNSALHRLSVLERAQFLQRMKQPARKDAHVSLTFSRAEHSASDITPSAEISATVDDKSRPGTFKILHPTPSLERPLVSGVTPSPSAAAPAGSGRVASSVSISSATGSETGLNAVNNIDNDPITELNDALSYMFANNNADNVDNATKSLSDALKAVHEMATTMQQQNDSSKSTAYSQYFLRKAPELVHALCGVMQTVHISCLNDAARNSNIIQKLLLRSNETLGVMLDRPAWTALITYNLAAQLIEAQLDLLTDDRLKQTVKQGEALVKQFNSLVLRMVDALLIPHVVVAGFTTMYRLLAQAAPQNKIDLALRIIWRSVKNLDVAAASESKQLGTSTGALEWPQSLTIELFVQLNAVMVRFPTSYWAKQTENEQGPLRAVRIIVARLARLQGFRLVQALDALATEDQSQPRSGELYSYVSKCLEQQNNAALQQQQLSTSSSS